MPLPSSRQPDEIELLSRRPRSSSLSSSSSSTSLEQQQRRDSLLAESPVDSSFPIFSQHDRHSDASLLSIAGLLRLLFSPRRFFSAGRHNGAKAYSHQHRFCGRKRLRRRCSFALVLIAGFVTVISVLTAVFNPSYTHLPPHYQKLAQEAVSTGRANPRNEKVFIAANIIDADLISGAWGAAVLGLIDLLGTENVFLSVFENDSGPETTEALRELEKKVKCNSSIISEHLPLEEIPTVTLPSGRKRIKRIAYLAEVRNRALRPLDSRKSRSLNDHLKAGAKFDKILFINDVVFDPLDAAQLLFSTNADKSGSTSYRAACAIDFINPFKFYDTFATRDLEGYGMGVPFFPWFSGAGQATSRKDVLAGLDAVRVRSCWGGMVSFEAKWFQENSALSIHRDSEESTSKRSGLQPSVNLPIRFRAETDTFWDASECCLIQADIQKPRSGQDSLEDVGVFINPFVRVAYSERTFLWLRFTRRFERLYTIPHAFVNRLAGLPYPNPRRLEIEGQKVEDKVWVYDDPNWQDHLQSDGRLSRGQKPTLVNGSFQTVQRTAGRGGFCGSRMLLVLRENPVGDQKKWEKLPIPPGR